MYLDFFALVRFSLDRDFELIKKNCETINEMMLKILIIYMLKVFKNLLFSTLCSKS